MNSKGYLVQIFFPFASTPQTPALVRVSNDALVSEVAEKALAKFASSMTMIGAESQPGLVPSFVISDYIVRLARGDGSADRSVSPLRFDATLGEQGITFPYMLHMAIDPTKDTSTLTLTDAYRDQLLSASPYVTAHALQSPDETYKRKAMSEQERIREVASLREASVQKLERERKAREEERIRQAELRQRSLETRVAAEKSADNQRKLDEMKTRQAQMQERNMRQMLQDDEDRKAREAENAIAAAASGDSNERQLAVAAARQARLREEAEAAAALDHERQAIRAATASDRHRQTLDHIIGKLHEDITTEEERRLTNEAQENVLEDMVGRQLHEMSVLDRARREKSGRSSASNERRAKREQSLRETADSYDRAKAASVKKIEQMEASTRDALAPRFALVEERAALESQLLKQWSRTLPEGS